MSQQNSKAKAYNKQLFLSQTFLGEKARQKPTKIKYFGPKNFLAKRKGKTYKNYGSILDPNYFLAKRQDKNLQKLSILNPRLS